VGGRTSALERLVVNDTLINVLIPTRERCDTLASALQTCLFQEYDHCRFIVCDNFSQDATREVVSSARDPRVAYINPGRRVSMSENWEFALSHVDDGYVTFLGDDDGLLPGALRRLNELVHLSGAPVVVWDKANYMWPSQLVEVWRNVITIPLENQLAFRESGEVLRRVGGFDAPFWMLPMMYTGAADMKLIARIRAVTGRFFHSRFPDVYSGVAIAANVPRFFHSSRPLSINGSSGHSSGASILYSSDGEGRKPAEMFAAEASLPIHPALVDAPSVRMAVAETFLQVRDHFPGRLQSDIIDLKLVVRKIAEEAAEYIPERYAVAVAAVRKIGEKNGFTPYVEQLLSASVNRPARPERQVQGINPRQGHLVLDASDFDVKNVADAARLIHHALVLHERRYDSPLGRLRTFLQLATRRLRRKTRRA